METYQVILEVVTMRSVSCALISFVVMYMATHLKGNNVINMTVRGAFLVGAFVFLIGAILFMIFGL